MSVTSLSLLDRLRRNPSADDWRRLDDVYRPLIGKWLARVPGLHDEADDLTQEVLVVVFRKLAAFERQRDDSFRTWLRTIAFNQVRDHWRKRPGWTATGRDATDDFLDRFADPSDPLAALWDREHDQVVTNKLLAVVERDCEPHVVAAFRRYALEGVRAADVAAELGMTEAAVFLAKSRVLRKLREEAGVMLD